MYALLADKFLNQKVCMLNCINLTDFGHTLFEEPRIARKAAIILKALLDAQVPRLSRIAMKATMKTEAA